LLRSSRLSSNLLNLKEDYFENRQVVWTRTAEVVIACKSFIPESGSA